jgi:hypothetical protein
MSVSKKIIDYPLFIFITSNVSEILSMKLVVIKFIYHNKYYQFILYK